MRSVGTARRRAEEFASLLEGPATDAREADRYAPLLELVGALREAPAPSARPEFVADLRQRLMAEASTALADADAVDRLRLPPRRRRHERRLAAVVGGVVMVGATASVAAAAQGSLPGDTLYPIKRAIEEAHTGISLDQADKGATLLSSARARLAEVEDLAGAGSADGSAVAGTLGAFSDQATQGSDLLLSEYDEHGDRASVTRIHDFAAEALARITALEPSVPADARDELVNAAQVVVRLDAAAQQACPTCGGPAIGEIPPIFVASATRPPAAVTDPATTGTPARPHQSPRHHHETSPSNGPGDDALPDVEAGDLPPGSVEQSTPTPTLPSPSTDSQNPLGTLTSTLTGTLLGGNDSGTKGTKDGGKDGKGGKTQSPGVGGVVEGLGDTVGGLLGGVTGGLLGGQGSGQQ